MKNFKLLLLAFLSLTIINCSEDDEDNTIALNAANLAGVYDMNLFTAIETETETVNGVSTITRYEEVGTSFNATFTFNSNGTLTTSGSYDYTEEEFVNGTLVDTDSDTQIFNDAGTYTVTNNTLTLNIDGESTTFVVTEFNSTDLTLRLSESEPDYSYNVEVGFTRQ